MSSRALRRHHRQRLKKARINYWGYGKHPGSLVMPDRVQGMVVNTPRVCSPNNCACCFMAHKDGTFQNMFINLISKESYREYMNTTGEIHDSREGFSSEDQEG